MPADEGALYCCAMKSAERFAVSDPNYERRVRKSFGPQGFMNHQGVSADGHTTVGVTRENCGIQQAAIWLRATEWPLLGGFPNALPCIDI